MNHFLFYTMDVKSKILLVIIDGFGISEKIEGNSIKLANTPNWDALVREYPWIPLDASGNAVGLPDGVMGNSEVGHLTIGSGRIEFQSFEKINQSIKNGTFKDNPQLQKLINNAIAQSGVVHLMGLVSKGGVHSHFNHLKALISIFATNPGIKKVYIHAFTDGRDVSPHSSIHDIPELIEYIGNFGNVKLTDIIGRFYAMDRDKRWERTKIAYDLLTAERTQEMVVTDLKSEIQKRYEVGETDEFLKPIILSTEGTIQDNDTVLFFNFRPDRARQLTQFFISPQKWSELHLKKLNNLNFGTMTEYDPNYNVIVLFPDEKVKNTLAEVLSNHGIRQLHVAETEKYAHVTYFLNGGEENPFPNEDRILIPSKRNYPTYDLIPEMSTKEIGDAVIKGLQGNPHSYDFIVCNFASPDMVGHTGNLKATIAAIEILDGVLGNIHSEAKKNEFVMIVTADHGNAEQMQDENGNPHTAHTTNPVPFLITKMRLKLKSHGGLSNVAPSILDLMGIQKPPEMTSETLIVHDKVE